MTEKINNVRVYDVRKLGMMCLQNNGTRVKTPRITIIDGIVKVPNERLYHKVTRRNRYIVFQRKINSNRSNVMSYLFRVSIMSLLRKPTNDPKLFAKDQILRRKIGIFENVKYTLGIYYLYFGTDTGRQTLY